MNEEKIPLDFPDTEAAFRMIDVGRKRVTRRRAVATGTITIGAVAFQKVKEKTLPKGDVLALAEIAGIMGAKKTPDLVPMCHTLPLDQVMIRCVPRAPDAIDVYCQASADARTGVEMEAVVGVQMAITTIWDLVKGTEPNLTIGGVRLLFKEGGKSGLWVNPDGIPAWLAAQLPQGHSMAGVKTALLVISDRASESEYEDESGQLLKERLEQAGAVLTGYDVILGEPTIISDHIRQLCEDGQPDLLITSGGTGPGWQNMTPDVAMALCSRVLDGLGEVLRRESATFTDTAWLSRVTAGMRDNTLIIALPGDPKAVKVCWEVIEPFLKDALKEIFN